MNGFKSFELRAAAHDDLKRAHELSQAVGWGHRLEDWQMMFDLGKGYVAVGASGEIVGIALWWPYGTDFATIGMVIVSPNLQRSGLGRRLMEAILDAAGGRNLALNATAEGRKLYESLGFVPTGRICTHYGTFLPGDPSHSADIRVRDVLENDWSAIQALDTLASSMDRRGLLASLKGGARGLVAESQGRISGFAMCRKFGPATVLGPIVAETEPGAVALASVAANQIGGLLRADIPEDACALAHWLNGAGLAQVGQVTTMWRPGPPAFNGTARIFGLAAQALG